MNKFASIKESFARFLCVAVVTMLASCSTPRSQYIREADYQSPIRVACVGDSITYGYGIKDRDRDSYPAQLASLLGNKWEVRNFGVNGATAFQEGTRPYTLQQAYLDALAFKPDVVILKLGTNDTSSKNWPDHKEKFAADYFDLVGNFSKLESRPRIYLCRPVPIFRDRGKTYDTDKILTEEIIPRINEVAKTVRLPVIDLYVPFEDKSGMFPDGVHPNADGTRIMAETIYAKLSGRTPASWQNR